MKKGKMKNFKVLRNEQGNMLLLSYFVIIVMIGLGAAFVMMSINEIKFAERNRQNTEAFHIAEAGIEEMLYHLRQDFVNDSSPDWFDGTIDVISFTPSSSYSAIFSNVSFHNGTYTVELKEAPASDHIWVKSMGTVNDSTHEIEIYVKMVNLSPWDNAIFAGAGAGGAMINGNVDIRGSVHVLGNGLAAGDYAMDLGGTAQLVGNNYNGLDAGLEAMVPALPTVVFNGETIETLNAELRVKKGIVGLSGSSSVGESDSSGNGEKETVDAVYVTDQYGGTSGSSAVHSDNGYSNAYDMGDSVAFPSLSDPHPDDPTKTFQVYYKSQALVLTSELNSLDPNSSFSYSNGFGSIAMDGSGNMTITGQVYVEGSNELNMSKAGSDKTITYSGAGSILVEGDVQIDVNLVTSGANSYPNNIIGIMTPQDIGMDAAGLDVMGIFYAEDEISISKQTDVMGSIVSNYFDMGTNVPSIYQVPEVVNNLPGGMIASNAYWYVQVMWMKL